MRKARRWRRVTMEELRGIWLKMKLGNVLYNGMTHAYLREKYGNDNLKHRRGYGWYKLV